MQAYRLIRLCVAAAGMAAWLCGSGQAWAGEGAGKAPSPATLLEGLVQESRVKSLGTSVEWTRILFYAPRWLRRDASVIDGSEFFLSPEGDTNPTAELEATLQAFVQPPPFEAEPTDKEWRVRFYKSHPICRYPARYAWLDSKLGLSDRGVPRPVCKEFDGWLEQLPGKKMSLVFSSHFAESAGSMFGHTLLKLHTGFGGTRDQGILDIGINYGAVVTTQNVLAYGLFGLIGGFYGVVDILPYYLKIQEYNNSESRDLWEFELNLPEETVRKVLLSAWELRHTRANYYYLTENCSYILLLLLEAGDASLKLTENLHPWVIPADTVRVVGQAPGLITKLTFRPSNLRSFRARYDRLSREEKNLVASLGDQIEGGKPIDVVDVELAKLPLESQARVLDSWVEWIDFQTKLAGSGDEKVLNGVRQQLLVRRAKTRLPSAALQIDPPRLEDPRHNPGVISIGLGQTYQSNLGFATLVHWRPALNEIASAWWGRPQQLSIRFMELDGYWRWSTLEPGILNWNLLSVESLAPTHPLKPVKAWKLKIAMDRPLTCDEWECLRGHIGWGGGRAYEVGATGDSTLYWLAGFQFGVGGGSFSGFYFGPRVEMGAVLRLADRFKLSAEFSAQLFRNVPRWRPEAEASLMGSLAFDNRFELQARAAAALSSQYRGEVVLKAWY